MSRSIRIANCGLTRTLEYLPFFGLQAVGDESGRLTIFNIATVLAL